MENLKENKNKETETAELKKAWEKFEFTELCGDLQDTAEHLQLDDLLYLTDIAVKLSEKTGFAINEIPKLPLTDEKKHEMSFEILCDIMVDLSLNDVDLLENIGDRFYDLKHYNSDEEE